MSVEGCDFLSLLVWIEVVLKGLMVYDDVGSTGDVWTFGSRLLWAAVVLLCLMIYNVVAGVDEWKFLS